MEENKYFVCLKFENENEARNWIATYLQSTTIV